MASKSINKDIIVIDTTKTAKEDKMEFVFEGTTYTETANGYYYKEDATKKVRISKKAFEDAKTAKEAAETQTTIIEDVVTLKGDDPKAPEINLAKVNGQYMAKRAEDEDIEYIPVVMEMLVNEDRGGAYAAGFKYLGYTYWTQSVKEAPKVKKTKKAKKSAFHTSTVIEGLTLTEKQVSFLLHLPDTCFWEDGLDSTVWVDVLADEIGGQFSGNPFLVGAMVSTLREKGLVTVSRDESRKGKPAAMALTEAGKKVAVEVGLEA